MEELSAVRRALFYRPALVAGTVVLSLFTAVFEGIGLSFLLPVVSLAQDSQVSESGEQLDIFVQVYELLGVPFTLEFVIVGAAVVILLRYSLSFSVAWLRSILSEDYIRQLQQEAYADALDAEASYFDEAGSDDIMNTIVTETSYAGSVITNSINLINQATLAAMYLAIAVYISPFLSLFAFVVLGTVMYGIRFVIESGSSIGDRVAELNRLIHERAQAGVKGIRDVKLFGMTSELREKFNEVAQDRSYSSIKLQRNKAAMNNFYNLATGVTLFVLIYVALRFANLSLSALGVFLFIIFRLAPRASNMNDTLYNLEGHIPHLYRTQQLLSELEHRQESTGGDTSVPESIDQVEFEDVCFSYDTDEVVFEDLSFSIRDDEFAAFVGPSGAGKSTIASLLTRMYEPDRGEILANGTPITEFNLAEWRSRISIVRQHPFIFDDTLRRNINVARRDASQDEIERVCDIAQVTEFLDELPDGYETELGEDGVRLSGGQKQRVALARALLKDAEFLVLDEATSDLDAEIEKQVHEAIEVMERDYGIMVIAHRLSTVINADRIYAVKDGRIVESGTHDELVSCGTVYADLYETQTGNL